MIALAKFDECTVDRSGQLRGATEYEPSCLLLVVRLTDV